MSLSQKIDFAMIISVKNANPNGDPLNDNSPRIDINGFGEISDVCLKRKIRDRLMDQGESIFVQSNHNKTDEFNSLKARFDAANITGEQSDIERAACKKWLDVRAFGQLFAFKKGSNSNAVSIGIRGPVTIQIAKSVEPINVSRLQITKSVNGEDSSSSKSSDTMGIKQVVDQAIYVVFGAISPQLAQKTGFSDEDAETLKNVLTKLFEGDASSARPEGSMAVEKLLWWPHGVKSGKYSSAKVHRALKVNADGSYSLDHLEGLMVEELNGF